LNQANLFLKKWLTYKYEYVSFKGTLHPFALSVVSLETQSYFLMVMVYSLIFPWDGRNKDLSVYFLLIMA